MNATAKVVPLPSSDRLKAVAIRALYALVACLPLRMIQWLGTGVGYLLWRLDTDLARTTRINIGLCFPELSAEDQENLACQSLIETGKTILETGACWNWSLDKCRSLIRHIEGEQLFAERCADERGLILLLPHLCTWEMLHPVLTAHTTFTAMYKPPEIPALDAWMLKVRSRSSAVMVPTNRRGVSELMKALKKGQCVVVLPDQEPERESGGFAPFFGIEALTVSLVHGLASKTNAQVLVVNAKRLPDGCGFDVVFRDANAINTPNVSESLKAMNAIVEAAVREIPAQYQWEYKRFKQGPDKRTKYYFDSEKLVAHREREKRRGDVGSQ